MRYIQSVGGRIVLVLSVIALAMPEARGQAAMNLVANGDFTDAPAGKPARWVISGDAKLVTQSLSVVPGPEGQPCARLECTRCGERGPATHAMLAQVGVVSLAKGHAYEFSCRMRAEGLAGQAVSAAIVDTKAWVNAGLEAQFTVTDQWRAYRRVFRAKTDVSTSSRLQLWFHETGTVFFANVRVVEVPAVDSEFTNLVTPAAGKNLVANGSFEAGAGGWSTLGVGMSWGDIDALHGSVRAGDAAAPAQHGRSFLRIPLGGPDTPVVYFDCLDPVARRELRPLAASLGWIRVEPGQPYTVSCYMRASRDGVPALLGVRAKDPQRSSRDLLHPVTLNTQWQRFSHTFKPDRSFVYVLAGPALEQEDRVDVDLDGVQLEKGAAATPFEPRAAVEVAMVPLQPGGIFQVGEPAALRLSAANHGGEPAAVKVTFRATDFEESAVELPAVMIEIPAGTAVQRDVALPSEWRGYYHVVANIDAAGRTEAAEARLAIVPKRTSRQTVCGINHAFVTADRIHLATKAGVSGYRDWSLRWQTIEPAKGEMHWDVTDVQLGRVLREGVSLMELMPPFPSANWSSEAPDGLPTTSYPGTRLRQAWGPKDPNELAEFVEKVVSRYKDRIRVWEFLNEAIYTNYALPADTSGQYKQYGGRRYTAADYVALLKPVSAAMHRADPQCKVMGGVAGHPDHLTRELIEAGLLPLIDLFNLHVYPGLRAPEAYWPQMDALLATMDAHGGRKPIWMTEFSYYAVDDLPSRPFIPGEWSWAEPRLLENERQCADYTIRFFTVMMSRGVERVYIHAGVSGKANEPNAECCLFDSGGAPRKVLASLAVFTDLLGGSPTFAGDRALGAGGHCVAFETGQRCVLVLWKEETKPAKVPAVVSGEITWIDPMGRTLGAARRELSSSPVYLVGKAGQAKALMAAVGG